MHNPSNSIVGPGPGVMLIYNLDCTTVVHKGNLIALNTVVLVIEELGFLPLLYKYAYEHSP